LENDRGSKVSFGRSLVALLLALFALACWSGTRVFVHRVAIEFEAGSSQLPPNGAAVLKSMLDDARQECLEPANASVVVEEVAALPLGKASSGPTTRTRLVAAALRSASGNSLTPFEGSVSPDGQRAHRLGLKLNQVLVELSCPPRGA
jgi:hypothetical protein